MAVENIPYRAVPLGRPWESTNDFLCERFPGRLGVRISKKIGVRQTICQPASFPCSRPRSDRIQVFRAILPIRLGRCFRAQADRSDPDTGDKGTAKRLDTPRNRVITGNRGVIGDSH